MELSMELSEESLLEAMLKIRRHLDKNAFLTKPTKLLLFPVWKKEVLNLLNQVSHMHTKDVCKFS